MKAWELVKMLKLLNLDSEVLMCDIFEEYSAPSIFNSVTEREGKIYLDFIQPLSDTEQERKKLREKDYAEQSKG